MTRTALLGHVTGHASTQVRLHRELDIGTGQTTGYAETGKSMDVQLLNR